MPNPQDWKEYVGQPLRPHVFLLPERGHFAFGNGFILSPWTNYVITVAHVVNGAGAVRILAHDTSGDIVKLEGVMLKMMLSRDLAAIKLKQPIQDVINPLVAGDGEDSVPVTLFGYSSFGGWERNDLKSQSARGEVRDPKLVYDRDLGVPGMSGSAIVMGGTNRVIGSHIGEPNFVASHAAFFNRSIIEELIG